MCSHRFLVFLIFHLIDPVSWMVNGGENIFPPSWSIREILSIPKPLNGPLFLPPSQRSGWLTVSSHEKGSEKRNRAFVLPMTLLASEKCKEGSGTFSSILTELAVVKRSVRKGKAIASATMKS